MCVPVQQATHWGVYSRHLRHTHEAYLRWGSQEKVPGHLWSTFLLGYVVEMFLMFSQIFLPNFYCGLLLKPLLNNPFIYSWADWRNLVISEWTPLLWFRQALTTRMHFLDNGILLYVGSYPYLALNGDTQIYTWLMLLYKNLALGSIFSQSYQW